MGHVRQVELLIVSPAPHFWSADICAWQVCLACHQLHVESLQLAWCARMLLA